MVQNIIQFYMHDSKKEKPICSFLFQRNNVRLQTFQNNNKTLLTLHLKESTDP